MIKRMNGRFGKHMALDTFTVGLGESQYSHRFGGHTWTAKDHLQIADVPLLLFVFDLSDSRVLGGFHESLLELPIFSYVNCSAWEGKQVYRIDAGRKRVTFVSREIKIPEYRKAEDRLPNPAKEKSIVLNELPHRLLCIDEESYWVASDNFLGGDSFIRVGGAPVWLDEMRTEYCGCGREMKYVCSVGYENYESATFIDGMPLFWGEGALYFFFCERCEVISVICQSS